MSSTPMIDSGGTMRLAQPIRFFGVLGTGSSPPDEHQLMPIVRTISPTHERQPELNHDRNISILCDEWHSVADGCIGWSGTIVQHGLSDASVSLAPDALSTAMAREITHHAGHGLGTVEGSWSGVLTLPETGQSWLIRDRLGLRLLYYFIHDGRLWFSDDLRPLLQIAPAPAVRPQALLEWMRYGSPLQPDTFLQQIQSVPPGALLRFDHEEGRITCEAYFEPPDAVSPALYRQWSQLSADQQEQALRERLDRTLEIYCRGRNKVSALLSGGVDSSTMTALAHQHARVEAVTIDLKGEGVVSELPFAKQVADALNIPLHAVSFGEEDFRGHLCETIHALGSPIILENAVALYHAAAVGAFPAGQLILDGEGADAIFGGSDSLFRASEMAWIIGRCFHMSNQRVRSGINRLRIVLAKFGIGTHLPMDRPGLDLLLGSRGITGHLRRERLLEAYHHLPTASEREMSATMLQEFYQDLLPMMARLDRMAWRANCDLTLPYLSREMMAFSLNLPMTAKVRWSYRKPRLRTKWLLKRLAARLIDPKLVYRPKIGFGMPGAKWVGSLPPAWRNDSWVAEQFGLSMDQIGWLDRHLHTRDRLFLFGLEIWGRLFARNIPFLDVKAQWQNR